MSRSPSTLLLVTWFSNAASSDRKSSHTALSFWVVHPHSRHGMHPQNKGISVGRGGLLCLTSDLSVKREVAQQFTTACQRRKRSV